ncbi:hypothetical protein H310_05620 [Aphanomyces invadans]|uniref:Potassium channel tetramerisation-type BTB domain-containing protein n=1 Tax=Aphanomyces invadans TaxID=157072 RepID=A0A024U9W7_9STRA|nr:hypothetical protein H310_05620 [Aphanomyces invadans]ETW03216.1 hypothetical protein H310_05620 [Aphanomyces invadans]|eukprot:XP_008868600.1 hypothetical protein H310_05620 [Aphanomyces invadans]
MIDDDLKERYRHVWASLEKEEKALALEKKSLSDEWIVIEKCQQCYEKDRATFEAMVRAKFEFLPDDDVVQFNIGGKLFKSTVKVWTRDRFSILAQLCTTMPKLSRDGRGHFYFDRDWWIFKYIYAFLRDKTLPHSLDVLRDLYYEASYYRITLLRHAIEAYLKNQTSGHEAAKVHHAFVSSDEIYRLPHGTTPTMTEQEWAMKRPPDSSTAASECKPVRRPSMTKGKEPELRAPPHVHPFRHEETKSRLNTHVQPPYTLPHYDQPPYDPALDFLDRRHHSNHTHFPHHSNHRTSDYDYDQSDHRMPCRDEDDHLRRRGGSFGDEYGRGSAPRRARDGDRWQHPMAFDSRRDTYNTDNDRIRDRHEMHHGDWDVKWHSPSSTMHDRRRYEVDVSGPGHHDRRHRHPHSDGNPKMAHLHGGTPLSPPLADPHGFLSRRKMSSM